MGSSLWNHQQKLVTMWRGDFFIPSAFGTIALRLFLLGKTKHML